MMNQGQEQFYKFILERVREENTASAITALKDSFRKQDEGSFGAQDARQFSAQIMSLLKPGSVNEVQDVLQQYARRLDAGQHL